MKRRLLRNINTGNFTGAFSDGAILFPLLVALAMQTEMNGAILLASAGCAYIAAALVFRVPMAVQPLKSVVITALAVGASAAEVRFSGFAVGVICLALSFMYADRVAKLVPLHLVHGLQLALGIILMSKGMKWGLTDPSTSVVIGFVVFTSLVLFFSSQTSKPIMGWVATAGMVIALFFIQQADVITPAVIEEKAFLRSDIILALVLPQLALTLTNSVVATHDVSQRYFGSDAWRVTPSRLLGSIGVGNILAAAVGGLPYCHGSGGLTAHVKGGAYSYSSNMIIGCVLLAFACLSWIIGMPLIPSYPTVLMAGLVFATGWFHIYLAAPSWKKKDLRWILLFIAVTALLTQNMLWALLVGVLSESLNRLLLGAKTQERSP